MTDRTKTQNFQDHSWYRLIASILILVYVLLSAVHINALHMSFLGINLDGNIKAVVDEFHDRGYSDYYYEVHNIYTLQGIYEGSESKISVMYTPETNTVYKVQVIFPFNSNWKNIKKDYQKIKKKISKEYGEPYKNTEMFTTPYKEGDKHELTAIGTGNCIYKTIWKAEEGSVILEISRYCISIIYQDNLNGALYESEKALTDAKRQRWFDSEFPRRKTLLDSCARFEVPEYKLNDLQFTSNAIGIDKDIEFVDLGLPSGTKWAACNLGAKTPSDFGSYRMWCGIYEHPRQFNESYIFSLYDLKQRGQTFGNGQLTQTGDLATIKYGETWSMPTKEQFEELLNEKYCYWEKAKLDGVNGFMVYSKTNLNYIFLPCAGYYSENQCLGKDISGYYWSSNAEQNHERSAYALILDTYKKSSHKIGTTGSYYGCSIRPVTYQRVDGKQDNEIINVSRSYFKFGSLNIDCDQVGEIYLDGMRYGNTPLEIDSLSTGVHILEIKADGYDPLRAEVNVDENESSKYSYNLVKAVPIIKEAIVADSIPMASHKGLKPQMIEKYDKFENYYEARVPSQLSRDVYCCVYKTVKGKSVRYMMLWKVLAYTCVHESPVKLILLFKDGTKKTFKVDMDTDVYEDPLSDRVCFSYTAAEYIPVSFVELLSTKELDAIKLYIFEEDITNNLQKEQFMTDLEALLQAVPTEK